MSVFSSFSRLEASFKRSFLGQWSEEAPIRDTWQFRWRIRRMKWMEEDPLLSGLRSICTFFLCSSVGSLALFLVLFGVLSFCAQLTFLPFSFSSLRFSLPFLIATSALPLLHISHSISHSLRNSLFFGRYLVDVCGISEERLGSCDRGTDRRWYALLGATVAAILSIRIPPLILLLLPLLFLLLFLMLSTPELLFLGALFAFPLLPLTAHPTVCLSVVLFLGSGIWVWKALGGRKDAYIGLCEVLLFLLAFLFLFGSVFRADRTHAIWQGTLRAFLLLASLPILGMLRGSRRHRVTNVLLLSGGICALFGILQYVTGKAELRWVDLGRFSDIGGRVTSFFDNPNILAIYLLLVLPFSLAKAFDYEGNSWGRMLGGIVFLSEGVCLILTWSRGAWLGMLLQLFLFFLLTSRRTRSLLLLSAPMLVTGVFYLPQTVLRRFGSIVTMADSSIRYRRYVWRGMLRMSADHPMGIGVGEDVFIRMYANYAVSGTERVMHAHSVFLQLLCEIGVVGLLVFCLLVLFLILRGLESVREKECRARTTRIAASLSIMGALVMGAFDHLWYHSGMLFLFFAVAALTAPDPRTEDLGGRD